MLTETTRMGASSTDWTVVSQRLHVSILDLRPTSGPFRSQRTTRLYHTPAFASRAYKSVSSRRRDGRPVWPRKRLVRRDLQTRLASDGPHTPHQLSPVGLCRAVRTYMNERETNPWQGESQQAIICRNNNLLTSKSSPKIQNQFEPKGPPLNGF